MEGIPCKACRVFEAAVAPLPPSPRLRGEGRGGGRFRLYPTFVRLHRPPNPDDKIGCSGCLQVFLLAAVVMGVGSVVVFLLVAVIF